MPMKRHHKIIIGGVSSLIVILLVINSIFLYVLFLKQNVNYSLLNEKVNNLDLSTQSKISELTQNLFQTNELVGKELGSLTQELSLLKASVGEDFSGIVESSVHAVVTIKTNAGFQGTGFIISEEGYIITNAHILADASGKLATIIQVITYEQDIINSEFIGYDAVFDIALLKISGEYEKLELDNSDNIQIGEKVIAIGNPLGLQFSVTQGIVSGIHRKGINGIEAYIQTDAALNPGNSGGPLINKQGKVIGINNFKISGGENLGFALESNYIKDVVNGISEQALNITLV